MSLKIRSRRARHVHNLNVMMMMATETGMRHWCHHHDARCGEDVSKRTEVSGGGWYGTDATSAIGDLSSLHAHRTLPGRYVHASVHVTKRGYRTLSRKS